jgi:hypothetical protein
MSQGDRYGRGAAEVGVNARLGTGCCGIQGGYRSVGEYKHKTKKTVNTEAKAGKTTMQFEAIDDLVQAADPLSVCLKESLNFCGFWKRTTRTEARKTCDVCVMAALNPSFMKSNA